MSLQSNLFHEVLQQALSSLRDNRLRTFLSILGITIGIGAVMTVGSATQGLKQRVFAELDTYGLKSVWVYRDWKKEKANRSIRQGSGMTNEDYKHINAGCCPSVVMTTPVVYVDGNEVEVRNGNNTYKAPVEGVGIHYIKINNDEINRGRDFRLDDMLHRKPVAIVAPKALKALFGSRTNAMGKTFRLNNQKYTVIGILKRKNRDILGSIGKDNYDINGRILLPYTLYQTYMGSKDIHTLQAEASSLNHVDDALEQIVGLLDRRHGYRYKYVSESMQAWIDEAESFLTTISLVGFGASGIVILVGGMGIMNIMSTSVIERTREIGIRKAIGATNQDILRQFLMEAMVISTIGGIFGLILGTIVAYGIGFFTIYTFGPSWITAVIALIVSMLVGMMSGYYPAHRAAQLRPVDALRYE